MTATQTYTAYQRGDNAAPIQDVVINQLPSGNGVVGWTYRDEDDPTLADEVRVGEDCRWLIRVPAGLMCDEYGSYDA